MDILATFGMERGRCEDGVWIPFGDARLLIASAFSRRHQLAMAAMKRAIRLRDDQKLPPFTDAEILQLECEIYAETILLGWQNITEGVRHAVGPDGVPLFDEDGDPKMEGVPLEPTPEHRVRMLRDAPPFLVGVKGLARELAPYSLSLDEGARKNSDRSSLGDSGGDLSKSNGSSDSPPAAP